MAGVELRVGILHGLQGGFGVEDFLRELVQRTVQQVLESELTSFLGVGTPHAIMSINGAKC